MSDSGYFMYRSFNIENFNVLAIERVSVIFMELRASTGYIHMRTEVSDWFLTVIESGCVYCTVVTES
jgi:hypothetical protein